MKKLLNIIPLFLLILLSSCGQSELEVDFKPISATENDDPPFDGNGIDIRTLSTFEKSFIPKTNPAVYDTAYMNKVDQYLTNIANEYTEEEDFKVVVKTIAWKESRWTHYFIDKDDIYLIKGDNGASFGMFQIYTKYHPELPLFKENAQYALDMIWKIYKRSKTDSCSRGSNTGESKTSFLRRVYATYNGGSGNTCRNNHHRDDTFVDSFEQKPWNKYL